ncbi:MAG: family 78 glycoside hydrolase catalytic domain [Caldilineaceae bacterium]|nr:family 78 glycoside hydrolase catalytic domain [Caldilineaceae bacterium]
MISPSDLQCEYAVDPVGVDTRRPRFSWLLRAQERGQRQSAYRILIASSEAELLAGVGDKWDSGRVASSEMAHVEYDGAALVSNERCCWAVQVWDGEDAASEFSAATMFSMGLLEAGDWQGHWIGATGRTVSAPLLRRAFTVDRPVQRATVHMSGLGYGELYVNGSKVGRSVLDPGNTYYNNDQPIALGSRVLYVSHDVTKLLQPGANVFGVMLGHGWYSAEDDIPPSPSHRTPYGDRPRLLLQAIIEHADGGQVSIVSDGEWKVAAGPITYNDFNNGECYDARLERPGWDCPGYDDTGWQRAATVEAPGGALVAQNMPPTCVTETLPAVEITSPSEGVYIFDLGQTITGWCRLQVQGPAGATVTLRHGTCLYADGTLDARSNLCNAPSSEEAYRQGTGRDGGVHHSARQRDSYTLKGDGVEVWEPRFTLHSFRYVEVTGYPGAPALDSVQGRVVHSAVGTGSRFRCSDELFNRIHSNVHWTLRGSFQSISQDAADRSERVAWLGDPGFIAEDYLYNFESAIFWTKWLEDIADAQNEDGDVPVVAPLHWRATMDAYLRWMDWASTYPIFVWQVYRHYGDGRVLARHYGPLKRMITFYGGLAEGHIMRHGLGDHMEPQADGTSSFKPLHTPMPLTSTAYYQHCVWILAQAARVLGMEEEARRYGKLTEEIREAFNREFLDEESNQYGGGSQTSNAVALHLELVPAERVEAVVANLVEDIRVRQNGHLTTGIIGTAALENALPRYGQAEVMAELVSQTTFPSWGEQIAKGATTVWESWNGDPEEELSLNMKMFCSTEVFFYRTLAGISPTSPGYRTVAIRPNVVGGLTDVDAEVKTQSGLVAAAWQREGQALAMQVTIPVNTRAKVSVPKLGLGSVAVREGGKSVWEEGVYRPGVAGIEAGEENGDVITFQVGSGCYSFRLVEE